MRKLIFRNHSSLIVIRNVGAVEACEREVSGKV